MKENGDRCDRVHQFGQYKFMVTKWVGLLWKYFLQQLKSEECLDLKEQKKLDSGGKNRVVETLEIIREGFGKLSNFPEEER